MCAMKLRKTKTEKKGVGVKEEGQGKAVRC